MTAAGESAFDIPWGYRIGEWEIEGFLASGAWGSVYAARKCGAPHDTAAVKVLNGARMSPGQRALTMHGARQEVEFSRIAGHPHVLRIFQTLEIDDDSVPGLQGAVALIMERAGGSLADMLAEATPGTPLQNAEQILRQTCLGMGYMHASGWVHGDLKPANVLIMVDGSVRLADFGLSVELEGTHAYVPPAGSTDYLPPEWWTQQATAQGGVTRPTRDVWAFGVLAHQVLSGGLFPFPGATARARAAAVREYASGGVELRLAPCIPDEWRPTIASCLAPDHQSRAAVKADGLIQELAIVPATRRSGNLIRAASLLVGAVLFGWFVITGISGDKPTVAADVRSPTPPVIGHTLIGHPQWVLSDDLTSVKNTMSWFGFAREGDIPLVGNWDGEPGDEVGAYRPGMLNFYFRSREGSEAELPIHFGEPGDWPVVGDWDGDGVDEIGAYRPRNATFYLRSAAGSETEVSFGSTGQLPLVGDWNGDLVDTVGAFQPADNTFSFRGEDGSSLPTVRFGEPGDIPLAGDWNADGDDDIGVYRLSTRTFVLKGESAADGVVIYGSSEVQPTPIVGDWNGDAADTQGVVQ